MPANDRVREVVAAALTDPQISLDDVDFSAAGKRDLVRITLDRRPSADPDGWVDQPTPAVTLDDIADLSRAISDALDRDEPFGGAAYVLEVGSPGVGRPLRSPEQFQRNVGRLVKITRGGAETTGRIRRAGPDAVIIAVGEPAVEETIAYAGIERASIVVEFTSIEEKDD
ncbi:ribosome maturation factor RimP [Nostocoides veronense]|uniref:Ribosome maturation factor RimP n=1 Tax=Nostocoides veronense TaxID=330836 RepID=A0ABN2LW19_9MICO